MSRLKIYKSIDVILPLLVLSLQTMYALGIFHKDQLDNLNGLIISSIAMVVYIIVSILLNKFYLPAIYKTKNRGYIELVLFFIVAMFIIAIVMKAGLLMTALSLYIYPVIALWCLVTNVIELFKILKTPNDVIN